MIKTILCIGLGKVGTLVATLLSEQFQVTGLDKQPPVYHLDLPFPVIYHDISDTNILETLLPDFDAVVSALPYYLNTSIARSAHKLGKHYFDLTEDVTSTAEIRNLSETATAVMAPQCGLAPGLISIIASHLANKFDRLRSIEMRVGALPQYPNGALAYSITWSPTGLINEYINDAEVIREGKRTTVPSLQGKEALQLKGAAYEAFYTSGGLGSMCERYEGLVDTLNYKTIRYPGHCDLMNFLIHELHLKEDKAQLEAILNKAKPPVNADVVLVYVVVEGWKQKQLFREEFCKSYQPLNINGVEWRAISWTTAVSIAAVIELVSKGLLPQKGFIKQEEIDFKHFLNTTYGHLFEKNAAASK